MTSRRRKRQRSPASCKREPRYTTARIIALAGPPGARHPPASQESLSQPHSQSRSPLTSTQPHRRETWLASRSSKTLFSLVFKVQSNELRMQSNGRVMRSKSGGMQINGHDSKHGMQTNEHGMPEQRARQQVNKPDQRTKAGAGGCDCKILQSRKTSSRAISMVSVHLGCD